MFRLLEGAPSGARVAVCTMQGSLCPVTLGHINMFVEARALLCDTHPRTSALRPRPKGLHKYYTMVGFIYLNGDQHVRSKLAAKGQVVSTSVLQLAHSLYPFPPPSPHFTIRMQPFEGPAPQCRQEDLDTAGSAV
jgi:hypothetical protein